MLLSLLVGVSSRFFPRSGKFLGYFWWTLCLGAVWYGNGPWNTCDRRSLFFLNHWGSMTHCFRLLSRQSWLGPRTSRKRKGRTPIERSLSDPDQAKGWSNPICSDHQGCWNVLLLLVPCGTSYDCGNWIVVQLPSPLSDFHRITSP